MGIKPVRHPGQRIADLYQTRLVNCCGTTLIIAVQLVQMRPLAVQPIGLVRAIAFANLKFLVQMRLKCRFHVLDLALGKQPGGHQPVTIKLQRAFLGFDFLVHLRLGEHRLVTLVMAKAAVTENIQHHVHMEYLPKFCGHFGSVHHGLWIIPVHVKNRCFHHQGDVGWVGRGARVMR